METRASYFLIGAFTLIVAALALLFVLWIGKASLDREFDEYDIVFAEPVSGVTVGGAVQYNGIQIGEVKKLLLDPADPRRVIAHVRVVAGTPVKTDTRAKLVLTGLTGVTVIQLSGGTPDAPRLLQTEGKAWPTIVADDSALQKLLSSSEDIAVGVNDLLLRVSKLLRTENLEKVDATLTHLETISGSIASRSSDISKLLADLSAASGALSATLRRSEALVLRLDRLAIRADAVLQQDAPRLLAGAQHTIDSIGQSSDALHAALVDNRAELDRFATDGMAQVGPALVDLRRVLERMQQVLDGFNNNPPGYLLGRDQLREVDPP